MLMKVYLVVLDAGAVQHLLDADIEGSLCLNAGSLHCNLHLLVLALHHICAKPQTALSAADEASRHLLLLIDKAHACMHLEV